ncbi:class I SAM-dependent methyltransferase [Anaerosacchariphilus polymeriproducens]|nr:class I SAM-dependent methyltransferase [Anaerosacchariphilus polymeriproducens]
MQNIYDNETFFEEYKMLRERDGNANILVEKPALFSLVPELNGKDVLDLGCGYGENCLEFVRRGAKIVVGIDISDKMLQIAKKENLGEKVEYIHMCMEDILHLNRKFDCIFSSLAVHYVKDFEKLIKDIYQLLNPGGYFIFSQENPMNTCFADGSRWTKDKDGNVICANLYHYSVDGERRTTWFVDGVVKYHRTFSSIINVLVDTGFCLDKLIEPIPDEKIMKNYPEYLKEIHKPDFLLVKAYKRS